MQLLHGDIVVRLFYAGNLLHAHKSYFLQSFFPIVVDTSCVVVIRLIVNGCQHLPAALPAAHPPAALAQTFVSCMPSPRTFVLVLVFNCLHIVL